MALRHRGDQILGRASLLLLALLLLCREADSAAQLLLLDPARVGTRGCGTVDVGIGPGADNQLLGLGLGRSQIGG